jgi:hypothetical protein
MPLTLACFVYIMFLAMRCSRGLRVSHLPPSLPRAHQRFHHHITSKPMASISRQWNRIQTRLCSVSVHELPDLDDSTGKPFHRRAKKASGADESYDSTPVYIVDNKETALHALKVLHAHPDHVWACDTEVADIDVKKVGPVGNGTVICASIYGGDDVDFGDGNTTLWIKNDGSSEGVLQYFKDWFENDYFQKVWHNYGFDRHVMYNEGIDCRGFAGDTMHMARLWDSSREKGSGGGDGYSLEALSTDSFLFPSDREGKKFAKTKMKELFGVAKLKKDGEESKIKELPDLRVLQNDPATRDRWIEYSARDAVATWWLRERLVQKLRAMHWNVNGVKLPKIGREDPNMYHFYMRYLKDFGELLTDMERNGIKLDTTGHLKRAEEAARIERDRLEKVFLDWARDFCSDIDHINIASSAQMQQLFFGEYEDFELKSRERAFKQDKSPEEIAAEERSALALNPYANRTATEMKQLLKERGLKSSQGTKEEHVAALLGYDARFTELTLLRRPEVEELCENRDLPTTGSKEEMVAAYLKSEAQISANKQRDEKRAARKAAQEAANKGETETAQPVAVTAAGSDATKAFLGIAGMPKKYREITITTIGMKPAEFTPTGVPQVSAAVLKKLSGKNVFSEGMAQYYGL